MDGEISSPTLKGDVYKRQAYRGSVLKGRKDSCEEGECSAYRPGAEIYLYRFPAVERHSGYMLDLGTGHGLSLIHI